MTGVRECQPEAAAPYQHVCPDGGCIYLGQPSFRGCGCHKTREQMMLARIEELTKALEKVRGYNIDIAACRINYRPFDHIQVIDEALAMSLEDRS